MNTKNKDPDELDKFIIGEWGIEGYLESNPEFLKTKLTQLLSESILRLRKYIEDPREKDITWDNPYIALKYAVECPNDDSTVPLIIWPEQKIFDKIFHAYPLSFLLREMTDYFIIFKEGDKIKAQISTQNRHLKKLTGTKREEYFSELIEKYFSDNRKPTFTLPFKLEFDDKEPKRKPLSGSLLLDIRPLWVDLDSKEANYTVTAELDIKEYKPTQWSKEEKKEFWEALNKELKTYAPQESFDFIDKLPIEPEVKPIIKDKGEVYQYPKDLANIQQKLFNVRGLTKKDFKGYDDEQLMWALIDGEAKFPRAKQNKIDRKKYSDQRDLNLIPDPPKLGVSQAKNMDALGYMLQRENWKLEKAGKPKIAELEFAFKDYAIMRGYTDAQIARGGGFLDELKRDLFTGAYTTYRLDKVEIDGKIYTAHGLPNFYILYEPANKKDKWRIVYNEPYRDYFINIGQYYPILLQAIRDKGTDNEKGFLYFFFKVVMGYANNTTEFKTQLKVSTLLNNIRAGDRTKDRPQEAFKVLCECIYYTATNYEGTIKEVRFFNNGKREKVKLIADLGRFKDWSYNDFKNEVLNDLGLTDIREALISFNSTPQKELTEGTEEIKQTGEYKVTL